MMSPSTPKGTIVSSSIDPVAMENGRIVQRQSSEDKEYAANDDNSETHSLLNSGDGSGDSYNKLDKSRHHGFSLSPQMYATIRSLRNICESSNVKVFVALLALIGFPLIAFGSVRPADSIHNFIIAIWSAWDGLLSISCLVVLAFTIPGAFLFAHHAPSIPSSNFPTPEIENPPFDEDEVCCSNSNSSKNMSVEDAKPVSVKLLVGKAKTFVFSTRQRLFHSIAGAILILFLILLGAVGPNSLVYPSWLWHPFLWGRYHVYDIEAVLPAIGHMCKDKPSSNKLCLTEKEWEVLSAGRLSGKNPEDVHAVQAGLNFARDNSIVINVLARDIKDSIPALRINVESLVPFFKKVALVVFENDSSDGTREEFKSWAAELEGMEEYSVDLMECEGLVDCKFNREYRDHVGKNYSYSSAIGEMHTYRNMAFDYIKNDPKYTSFSHLMVLDVDLAVPFSPLGILHTLGLKPENVVASSGRQPWPTAFGSLITPYDLNGFREHNEENTMGLENWHRRFCSIQPLGERWWSECDAVAPTHLIAILWNDRKIVKGDFYQVDSAFNGAVLYPIDLLRKSNAKYDKGESNQRCEHVGLHAELNKLKPMYVDKKWDMHLMPNFPGGAAWGRAKKASDHIMRTPKLVSMMVLSHLLTVGVFVYASFAVGVYAIHPLVSSILKRQAPQTLPTRSTTK